MKHIYTLEFWRDIEGYEGLYQVNNVGQVKSLISNKILKPVKKKETGWGYPENTLNIIMGVVNND